MACCGGCGDGDSEFAYTGAPLLTGMGAPLRRVAPPEGPLAPTT